MIIQGNEFPTPQRTTGSSLLGLYDPAAMRRQSISRGLLSAGANMLAQEPSRFPIGIGQSLGLGLQGFAAGMDQGKSDYYTQLGQWREEEKYKREQKSREAFAKIVDGLDPNDPVRKAAEADFDGTLKMYTEEQVKAGFKDPIKVGEGDTLLDANTRKPIYQGAAGAVNGKSQEERSLQTLRTAKPDSAEYRDAYFQLYRNPKFIQTEYGTQPIMPAIPPGVAEPTYGGAGQQQQSMPGAPDTSQPRAGGIVPGTERTPEKLKMAEVGAAKTLRAIDKYEALLDQYGEGPTLRLTNPQVATLLNTAYSDLMIEGKELNNLGVLAGPDMGIMEREMTPPTGWGAAIPNLATMKAQIAHIRDKVTGNLNEMRNQYVPPGPGSKKNGASSGKAAAPRTQAEFDALPSGALYQDPDDQPGVLRRKP
jgi:hypothetical protein